MWISATTASSSAELPDLTSSVFICSSGCSLDRGSEVERQSDQRSLCPALVLWCLCLRCASRKMQDFFLHLAVVDKGPGLCILMCVEQSNNDASHMAFRIYKIGGIEEVEANGFAIGRSCGLHAGLVASGDVFGRLGLIPGILK